MVNVDIHRATKTDGSAGAKNKTWAKVFSVEGTFRQLSGSKRFIDSVKKKEIVAKFYCDYRTDFTDKDRLVYDSVTYDITNVKDPNEEHDHLEVELAKVN